MKFSCRCSLGGVLDCSCALIVSHSEFLVTVVHFERARQAQSSLRLFHSYASSSSSEPLFPVLGLFFAVVLPFLVFEGGVCVLAREINPSLQQLLLHFACSASSSSLSVSCCFAVLGGVCEAGD